MQLSPKLLRSGSVRSCAWSHPGSTARRLILLLALLMAPVLGPVPALAQKGEAELDQAERLLEAGDATAALALIEPLASAKKPSARALLLRSTAAFIQGDRANGRLDLERALEIDPQQRQAWLNLGALELADGSYDGALRAFTRAHDLDPEANDNWLNLGTALLWKGESARAEEMFRAYAARAQDAGEAWILIAKNYAVTGQNENALDAMERAVQANERTRLTMRMDPAFERLRVEDRFHRIIELDTYVYPEGGHLRRIAYDTPYEISKGHLLGRVVDALRRLGIRFDARIEVTPNWSLVWGDLRIKVLGTEDGRGLVEMSATRERYSDEDFKLLTDRLARQIQVELTPKLPSGL